MLTEISLHILDLTENSVRAGADLVTIRVCINEGKDTLTVEIEDNGCGMNKEQLAHVTDPFFTTRTTRKVGLGIPFFKQAAELTGGSFEITSKQNVGTKLRAFFGLSSIDRMPLGDMVTTMHTIIVYHPKMDFIYEMSVNASAFILDTREFRQILGDVMFDVPEVSTYIKEYLEEGMESVNQGTKY